MYEANKDYGTDIKVRYVTGQNELRPMSVFSIGIIMLNSQILVYCQNILNKRKFLLNSSY